MLDTPDALDTGPILEPQDVLLAKRNRESIVNPLLDDGSCLGGEVTIARFRRDRGFRPGDEVENPRGVAVGPVVDQDLSVLWICC